MEKKSIIEAYLNSNIVIRTVTMHHIGTLVDYDDEFLKLEPAVWLADSGRWANALSTGEVDEVEPFTSEALIGRGGIIDITPWGHPVPTEVK